MSYKLVTVLLVMATYSGFKIPRVTLVNEGSFESSSYSYVLLSKQTTNWWWLPFQSLHVTVIAN